MGIGKVFLWSQSAESKGGEGKGEGGMYGCVLSICSGVDLSYWEVCRRGGIVAARLRIGTGWRAKS